MWIGDGQLRDYAVPLAPGSPPAGGQVTATGFRCLPAGGGPGPSGATARATRAVVGRACAPCRLLHAFLAASAASGTSATAKRRSRGTGRHRAPCRPAASSFPQRARPAGGSAGAIPPAAALVRGEDGVNEAGPAGGSAAPSLARPPARRGRQAVAGPEICARAPTRPYMRPAPLPRAWVRQANRTRPGCPAAKQEGERRRRRPRAAPAALE